MLARLVIDQVLRSRYGFGPAVAILFLAGLVHSEDAVVFFTPTLSLGVGLFLGPMFAMQALSQRELKHLPLTNRDLWQMAWTLATVLPTSVILVSGLASSLTLQAFTSRPEPLEMIVLRCVYVFAWTGVVLRTFVLTGYSLNAGGRQSLMRAVQRLAMVLATCGALLGPMLIANRLPVRWAAFTPLEVVLLVACLAVSIGSLFWVPQRSQPDRSPARATSTRGASRPQLFDRLTGLPRVFLPDLLLSLGILVLSVVMSEAVSTFAGERDYTFTITLVALYVGMNGTWLPWARLLRVLPLSVGQINALLVISPAVIWMFLWAIIVALRPLSGGVLPFLPWPLVLGLIGASALGNAAMLLIPKGSLMRVAPVGFIFVVPKIISVGVSNTLAAQIGLVTFGVVTMIIAVAINDHTLKHSTSGSAAYRPAVLPFDGSTANSEV